MVLCFWADGWAGLPFAPAGDSHTVVCVTHWRSRWHCQLAHSGSNEFWAGALPSFSTMVGRDCHLLRQGIHTLWCVSLSSGSNEFWAGIDLAGILHYG